MYRGTTPTFELELDFDASELECLFATFKQQNEVVLEKRINDCECSGNKVSFTLSQEETLQFKCGQALLQIRAKLKDGTTIADDPVGITIKDVFKEGAI